MRDEWNGLQVLIFKECPSYYVHSMIHRLQLTLVATSREVILTFIINIIYVFCEHNDELHIVQEVEIAHYCYL